MYDLFYFILVYIIIDTAADLRSRSQTLNIGHL